MRHTDTGPQGLYFEEIEPGAEFVTRGRTITEADLVQFAALTGDYNPMHTDERYMQTHPMGQRVAHGMLSLSYAVGQIYQLGFMERTVIAFRSVEMKFSLPVFIGDTLHSVLRITDKRTVAPPGRRFHHGRRAHPQPGGPHRAVRLNDAHHRLAAAGGRWRGLLTRAQPPGYPAR